MKEEIDSPPESNPRSRKKNKILGSGGDNESTFFFADLFHQPISFIDSLG
jgi:hypothetical protein